MDYTQQNAKWRLCGEKDETTNLIKREFFKLAQKQYKTQHDWVGKVIHLELRKKLKFDHTTKWYIHKPESILENVMLKILWDFEMQIDHLIPARKSDLALINPKKWTCHQVNLTILADHRVKISKENGQILKTCQRIKLTVRHEGEYDTDCSWCTWNSPKAWKKDWAGGLEIRGRIKTT